MGYDLTPVLSCLTCILSILWKVLNSDARGFQYLAWLTEMESFEQNRSSDRAYARLCTTRIYRTIKPFGQTIKCMELAARYYYNKLHPGKFLLDLEAIDSHSFDRYDVDTSDENAYYHVNFKANKGTRDIPASLFFAELKGENGPERVTICSEVDSSGDLDNCQFCTGITHPVTNFVGCLPLQAK